MKKYNTCQPAWITNRFHHFTVQQGISEKKIAKSLNQFHVNVVHKPVKTGVFYKIKCKGSKKVYIGESLRASKNKNKRAVITAYKNSLLAQHCAQNSREFDLDSLQIVDRCSQWPQKLLLEAWRSMLDQNEHIQIPHMYTILANSW